MLIALLLFLSLIPTTNSVKMIDANSLLFLAPHKITKMAPFILEKDPTEDETKVFVLKYTCSETFQKFAHFKLDNVVFCSQNNITGTIIQLNERLQLLKATFEGPKSNDLFINYNLFDELENNLFTFTQGLQLIDHIPVHVLKTQVEINGESNASIARFPIFSLNRIYLSSFENPVITISQTSDLFSQLSFEQGTLYLNFKMKTETQNIFPIYLMVSIVDVTNKIQSEDVYVRIISNSTEEGWVSSVKLPEVIFMFVVLMLLASAVVYCFRRGINRNQNQLMNSINANKAQNNDQNASKIGEKSELLTQSIITWNKRLVELHKKKTGVDTQEDAYLITMPHDRKVRSSNSDRMNEFGKEYSKKNRPFDDLSEIHIDGENDLKSPAGSCGNSSFLEDFNL